ncbi:hypothetical protein RhiirA4_455313 [Rhizophagus irregularis]|uniref:Uncharacterized protein n=1 Tax=Rhizophagus irregularis TaxID=588596 RepID=A0A2I1G508_9GLOM|nr:hypothetical protein RhiirA4_455313 [Rhizophagus irregularis]
MLEEESRVSSSDSDYDEFDFDYNNLDDEIMDGKFEDIKIFNDIDFSLDKEIMDNKSVDLNHSIRDPLEPDTRTERILVQA